MTPEPRYCPRDDMSSRLGIPNRSDSTRNWITKMAAKKRKWT